MKTLLSILAVCLFISCSNENENQEINLQTEQLLVQEYESSNQKMTDYISEITTDSERRKKYVAEVNQKPDDEAWQLECFRKHYSELADLMTKVKEADLNLQTFRHKTNSSSQTNH